MMAIPIEEFQNCENKRTASRKSTFFARKVHKLKKMLHVILNRGGVIAPQSPEEIQNAVNEELERKLKEDLDSSAGVRGEAIQTIVEGTVGLLSVQPGQIVSIPVHFVSKIPGQFVWSFLPPPDHDICSRVDSTTMTTSQNPEKQTPVFSS